MIAKTPFWLSEFISDSIFLTDQKRGALVSMCLRDDAKVEDIVEWITENIDDPYLELVYGKRRVLRQKYRALERQATHVEEVFDSFLKVQIPLFSEEETEGIILALQRSRQRNLIIDLRDCGGGSVSACCRLLNQLLPPGPYLEIMYNNRRTIHASPSMEKPYFENVIVWVDKKTRSAAEIFAYVIRAKLFPRCRLVGLETAGKTIGQTTLCEPDNRLFFSFSSFRWRVPEEERTLTTLINEDAGSNSGESKSLDTDDYYLASLR